MTLPWQQHLFLPTSWFHTVLGMNEDWKVARWTFVGLVSGETEGTKSHSLHSLSLPSLLTFRACTVSACRKTGLTMNQPAKVPLANTVTEYHRQLIWIWTTVINLPSNTWAVLCAVHVFLWFCQTAKLMFFCCCFFCFKSLAGPLANCCQSR